MGSMAVFDQTGASIAPFVVLLVTKGLYLIQIELSFPKATSLGSIRSPLQPFTIVTFEGR